MSATRRAEPEASRQVGLRRFAWPDWLGPLLGLAALVTVVSVYNPAFLSVVNVLNVLQNSSYVGLIAVGMTFVILSGGIDLSVGSLVAFAGGFGIWAMNHALAGGTPEWLAVALAFAVTLAAGLAAGAMNGVLVTLGRVAPFIATLGGLAAYRSLAQALADGGEFRSGSDRLFQWIGNEGVPIPYLVNQYGNPVDLPWSIVIFVAAVLIAILLLRATRFGRHVYAVGSSERTAKYSAVRVGWVKFAAYTMLGGLTGLAALLNASRMNSVSSGGTGLMWELDAIAAVVIGGTRLSGGRGTVIGTVVGLLILGVIGNMLNLLQVSTYLQDLVKGVIIVAAVLIQRVRREG